MAKLKQLDTIHAQQFPAARVIILVIFLWKAGRRVSPHRASLLFWSLLLILFGLVTGCGEQQTPTPAPASPTAPTPTQPGTITPEARTNNRQIVFWVPPFTGLDTASNAGGVLQDTLHQFEQANPSVEIDVQVKAESGPASLFNYLRSTQRAAPAILPDAVLIETQELWQLVDLGLVQPLTLTNGIAMDAVFPFAAQDVIYRDNLYGIPYTVNLPHAVYTNDREAEALPENWETLLAGDNRYYFPGGSDDTEQNLAALLHYLGAGGTFAEDSVEVDVEALETMFDFLHTGQEVGIIPSEVLEYTSFSSLWRNYSTQSDGIIITFAGDYLSEQPALNHGPIPMQRSPATSIGVTWAFALITQDEAQRAVVLEIIQQLLSPEVQGNWSLLAHRLPSHRPAFRIWGQDTTYQNFLLAELTRAVGLPNGRTFAEFAARLQTAQTNVLRGELSPGEAVQSMSGSQ